MSRTKDGFTLVELLVVITIIVILISLLAPGLEDAKRLAQLAKCGANLHAIGVANGMYLLDNKNVYAGVYHWHGLLGKYGVYEPGGTGHPNILNPGLRPLNVYLGYTGSNQRAQDYVGGAGVNVTTNPSQGAATPDLMEVPVAECPADAGDPLQGANGDIEGPYSNNCYKEFGTSYIVTVVASHYRIDNLYGNLQPGGVPSKRSTKIAPQHSKVLVTDWVVYGNRRWTYPKSRVHSTDPRKRQVNTAFADGHVNHEEYELIRIDDGHGAAIYGYSPGEPSWHWW